MSLTQSQTIGADTLTIRPVQGTDELHACARLMADSEPWITLKRDYAASLDTLSVPSKELYVALIDDQIIGFTLLNMQGAFVGYIQSLCVALEWQGKGLGSILARFAEDRILRETPNVFITVSSFNPAARRLYERLGYQVIGELTDYIVPGHSEILMRKTIAPLSEFVQTD
jgi:ribosomal protein S18 acetylase RimI-like enzyme